MQRLYSAAIVRVLLLSVYICVLVGCKTITYDRLPDNARKGYAEFYSRGITGIGAGTWGVSEDIGGTRSKLTGGVWSGTQRRRIALRPGRHTFVVGLGDAHASVALYLTEGKVKPVRVIIVLEPSWNRTFRPNDFRIVLREEQSYDLEKK